MSRPGIGAHDQDGIEFNPNQFDAQTMQRELASLYRIGIRQIFSLTPEFRSEISAHWATFSDTLFFPVELPNCALPIGNEDVLDRVISQIDTSAHKSVIHCTGGIGRTGFILTAYIMASRVELAEPRSPVPVELRLFDQENFQKVKVTPQPAISAAIQFVRSSYNANAIEFTNQLEALTRWQALKHPSLPTTL